MAEGFTTLEMVSVELEAYLNSKTEPDINGSIISRNIKYYIDVDMIDKAEGADLRVCSWNMSAPYMRDYLNSSAIYKDDKIRGEVMADVLAAYYPDIIGASELYNSQMSTNYQDHYASVARELSDYYAILEDSPYEYGKPNEDVMPNLRYGIPENIMYKKIPTLSFVQGGDILIHLRSITDITRLRSILRARDLYTRSRTTARATRMTNTRSTIRMP